MFTKVPGIVLSKYKEITVSEESSAKENRKYRDHYYFLKNSMTVFY